MKRLEYHVKSSLRGESSIGSALLARIKTNAAHTNMIATAQLEAYKMW